MINTHAEKLICSNIFILLVAFTMTLSAQPDSLQKMVTVVPAKRYAAGSIHKFFLGYGYREVWTTPVKVQELNLDTYAGGLTPLKRGGGLQTNSLRFTGADSQVYVFRSMDKYPERGYPEAFRGTIIETLGKDQVSLMLPFGSLVVDVLADRLGVLHPKPQYFVMPDDERLGEFKKDFAGMLGSMEVRPDELPGDKPGFANAEKIIGSEKFSENLDKSPKHRIDTEAYLTARLLDIFVGDWDRHADQWRWAGFEDSTGTLWKPIARDRDFSFVVYDGIVPYILDRRWANRDIDGYNRNEPDAVCLTFKARHQDGRLLAGVAWNDWLQITDNFIAKLDDQILSTAVNAMPPEVCSLIGKEMLNRMEHRRSQMKDISRAFYEQLSMVVNIQTTDKDEIAEIEKKSNGNIAIKIYQKKHPERIIYNRTIEQNVTDEIRLYLLDGDDQVIISGSNNSTIKLRIIGGKGDEQIIEKNVTDNIYFYDTPGDMKKLHLKNVKTIASKKKEAYARPPIGYPESRLTRTLEGENAEMGPPFDYGYTWMPLQAFGFDRDHGVSVGAGLSIIKYGFRMDPYASKRQFTAKFASKTGKFQLKYKAVHYDFIRGASLTMHIKTALPESKPNFFGYGNDTPFDKVLEKEGYYTAENKYIFSDNQLAKKIWDGFSVLAGLNYQYLKSELDDDLLITALTDSAVYNLRTDVHHTASIFTGIEYDSRDNESAPRSGIFSKVRYSYFPSILKNKAAFTRIIYTNNIFYSPWESLTIALRANGEYVQGKYPYYYASYIGGEETLRGYNLNRFAGDLALSGSFEVRWFIGRIRIIFPSDFGLVGFADAGRVWYEDESPGGWHNTQGGGFYLAPILRDYTFSLTFAHSKESFLLYWNMGFSF